MYDTIFNFNGVIPATLKYTHNKTIYHYVLDILIFVLLGNILNFNVRK